MVLFNPLIYGYPPLPFRLRMVLIGKNVYVRLLHKFEVK